MELFGRSLCVEDFPDEARELKGMGMSDSEKYASRLSRKFRYTNTFYHQEPKFDVQNPPNDLDGRFNFVISSDVFEHVAPPVEQAFKNLHDIFASGGILIFTVPFGIEGETIEHFPDLYDYRIEKKADEYTLRNCTKDGRIQEFHDLCFHGGPGSTLEMRLFSESDICKHLADAGFSSIRVHREPAFEWGIYWNAPWSVPVTARA